MATARLANMPLVDGLSAFIAGSVMFALLGRNRQMSIGADSTIAPVFAAGVATVAAVGTPRYAHLVTFLALRVGALLVVVGLLRLGWVAEFLSGPVVTGILAGIAIEIVVRQLPIVVGVADDGTTMVGRLRALVGQRGHVIGWDAGIAIAVLSVIMLSERIDRRIRGPLIGLVASIGAVAVFDLQGHGVHTIGAFHPGFPLLGVPSVRLDDVGRLVGTALTIAFVCVVQTAATSRSVTEHSETQHPGVSGELNGDLVALGAGNLLAGLSGSFALNASPPRTAIVEASGGRSQLTGLIAAGAVFAVVLFAAGLLQALPQATLGAILIYVATGLSRAGELRRVLRFDRFEFTLAAITMAVVAVVGIEQGVVVAIVLALAQRTRLSARPATPSSGGNRAPTTGSHPTWDGPPSRSLE